MNPRLFTLPLPFFAAVVLGMSLHAGAANGKIDRVLDLIDERSGGAPESFPEDVPVYPGLRGVTFVETEGIKIGQIIHAVRVAITGQAVGPGLFDCVVHQIARWISFWRSTSLPE